MNKELEKNKIIEEIYLTGRYNGEYMGIYSRSKQNAIKAYIKQWLAEKGIKENMGLIIEDFYQELFVHIGKIKAETLIELTQNNKKLFATICTIIQRQLMKVDVNPIINYIKKTLKLNQQELEEELSKVNISLIEYKELKKVTKKQLKAMVFPTVEYLLKLLKVHMEVQANKIPSTNVSYFEKLKHNSIQLNKEGLQLQTLEENKENEENNFYRDFNIGLNEILDAMNPKELKRFKALANRKIKRAGKIQSPEQKEREKKYWEALETNVFETINRIKFRK